MNQNHVVFARNTACEVTTNTILSSLYIKFDINDGIERKTGLLSGLLRTKERARVELEKYSDPIRGDHGETLSCSDKSGMMSKQQLAPPTMLPAFCDNPARLRVYLNYLQNATSGDVLHLRSWWRCTEMHNTPAIPIHRGVEGIRLSASPTPRDYALYKLKARSQPTAVEKQGRLYSPLSLVTQRHNL